jgi:sporulation protein YlmC with PRC-barrel domain
MLRRVSDLEDNYLNNIRGINIYGIDNEKLGTVDDALVDDVTGDLRYLLVDSGWLRSHRFVVPADQVFAYNDSDDLYANLHKADVESLPELRDDTLLTSDAFARYESDYRRAWRYDADPGRVRPSNRLVTFRRSLHDVVLRDRAGEKRSVSRADIPASYVATGSPRPTAVYGVYSDREHVEKAVDRLRKEGFLSNDISVVFPDRDMNKEFALEKNTKAPEGAMTGGGTGFLVGGTLGWLVGIGTLAIPGVGPLLAAGPIVAALAGAGVGGAVGGIAGGLIGLGLPEIEARRYEEEIKAGRILISVHCESVLAAQGARKVLEDSGAKDVFLSGEQRAA